MANECRIIDNKVGGDHRSSAENPMVHALSRQWPFGESKLDLKQSSLRRVRSNNLKLASWRAELVFSPSKISGVGADFGLLVHVLLGPNKQRARKRSPTLSWIRRNKNPPGRLVRSRYSFYKSTIFVIRGAHLARPIIENKWWEGLDRMFKQAYH